MKNKQAILALSASAISMFATSAQAGVIVGYDMDLFDGGGALFTQEGNYDLPTDHSTMNGGGLTDPNLETVTLSLGEGYGPGTGAPAGFYRINTGNAPDEATATNEAEAVSQDAYIDFTLNPNSGFQFSLDETDSLALNYRRYSTAGTTFIRSSLDGFTSTLDSNLDDTDGAVFSFDLAGFTNITSAVTFRIYSYDPDGSIDFALRDGGDIGGTDYDFVVNGSVTAVPEPSTYALLGGIFSLGFVWFRRRNRN